jgi:hypothetical protein
MVVDQETIQLTRVHPTYELDRTWASRTVPVSSGVTFTWTVKPIGSPLKLRDTRNVLIEPYVNKLAERLIFDL